MLCKVTQLIFSSDSRFANLMKPYFIHKRIKIREILLLIKIMSSFFKKLRPGKKEQTAGGRAGPLAAGQ